MEVLKGGRRQKLTRNCLVTLSGILGLGLSLGGAPVLDFVAYLGIIWEIGDVAKSARN